MPGDGTNRLKTLIYETKSHQLKRKRRAFCTIIL
jgi:hypothetical protein